MTDNKRASIENIADTANVYIATVSRALNKSGKVRQETVN
jgi:DNA-binding LacI/PurR family transcriptional regulator